MTTETMKAGCASEDGLVVREVPRPAPKENDVLVKVRAAGLNRADLNAAKAANHPTMGQIGSPIGMEWSGEVVDVGPKAKGFKPGDRVMCSGPGGYAEYAVADAGRTLAIPANNMSWEQAAALPIALLTAHDALVTNGRLADGQGVLVQGASSGVGIACLQIARLFGASPVIGSSTDPGRRARLAEHGATLAIDSRAEGWVDEVLEATGGKGVDLVVDMISAGVANANMKAAKVLGRIVNVGRLGGMTGEFDYDLHALRRLDYIGVTFRTRSIEEVREINRRMREDLWEAVTDGRIALPIDRSFPLDRAPDAHAHMRANAHFGKIVLTM